VHIDGEKKELIWKGAVEWRMYGLVIDAFDDVENLYYEHPLEIFRDWVIVANEWRVQVNGEWIENHRPVGKLHWNLHGGRVLVRSKEALTEWAAMRLVGSVPK